MKLFSLIFFTTCIVLSYAQNGETFPPEIDVEAKFDGGENAMLIYLSEHIEYPEKCKKEAIEGVTYVGFYVEEDGSVTGAQVLRGTHELLDKEAVRVIESMPNWIPAKSDGKPVKSQVTIPIKFTLDE